MKKLLLSLALLTPMTAMAEIDLYSPYVGGQISRSTFEWDASGSSATPYTASLFGGFAFNDVVGLEAQVGMGATDDSTDLGDKLSVKTSAGVYLRGNFEISSDWLAYGLLGYTTQRLELSAPGWSAVDNKDDGSIGGGLEYNVNNSGWTFRGGFLQAARGGGFSNIQYSAGMAYRF